MERSENRPPCSPRPHDDTRAWQAEPLTLDPTPGEVIGQIGRVILTCLSLALLARLLVPIGGLHGAASATGSPPSVIHILDPHQ